MYELVALGKSTYYIDCPARIGVYLIDDKNVCIIDSGNSRDTGKKVLKILSENGWMLKTIIATHHHADHIGGNQFLQEKTNCEILSYQMDRAFLDYPILNSSYLYGGCSPKQLHGKFFLAGESKTKELTKESIPDGLEFLSAEGHSFSQVIIKTSDDVWFVADVLASENTIEKYAIAFLQNIEKHLETLEKMKILQGKFFVGSHVGCREDINPLIKTNIEKTLEIAEVVYGICEEKQTFDDLLKKVFDHYNLTMDFAQHTLVGCTIKSFLTYLQNCKKIVPVVMENKLYWESIPQKK